MDALRQLHVGLSGRPAPQDVARTILQLPTDGLPERARVQLEDLGRARSVYKGDTFPEHDGLQRPAASAAALVGRVTEALRVEPLWAPDGQDPNALRAWVDEALAILGFADREPQETHCTPPPAGKARSPWSSARSPRSDKHGHADFRERLNSSARDPRVPRRLYRHAVRAVLHLQQRAEVFAACRDLEYVTRFAKSRLAADVKFEDFVSDVPTALFVAYYTSRLTMRTMFTMTQVRPMDELAEQLLSWAVESDTCRYDVLAHVLTRQSILDQLTDRQLDELATKYWSILKVASRCLERAWDPHRDRTEMVVRQGDDSTTWNLASRAFDQARTGLLNLQLAGVEDTFGGSDSLPGKVPALVASDIAAAHALGGRLQHGDVTVWAELPLPWEVVLYGVCCPAALVEQTCETYAVDPRVGWTRPYRQEQLETTDAAPNLVHGVAVNDPTIAAALNEFDFFGGPSHLK